MLFRQTKRKMMPTGKINIPWIAARITEKQLAELAALVKRRCDPRRVRLEKKRDKLVAAIEKIDAEIARLTGEARPAAASGKRRGRKPGRRPVGRPRKAVKPGKAAVKATGERGASPARLAALEKAHAARAAKRAAAQGKA